MTLNEQVEQRVYDKLRAFDGMELGGNEAVSGSIASVLSEGEVLADNGNQYSSIQDAVDASEGWTFVGPGQFYENVTIDKDGFMLQGAGYDALIDGGTTGYGIKSTGSDCTIKNVSVRTTDASNQHSAIRCEGNSAIVKGVTIKESSYRGIAVSEDSVVTNCTIESATDRGIQAIAPACIIKDCTVLSCGRDGIKVHDDTIVSNNTVQGTADDAINVQSFGNDSIVIGNRLINAGDRGITINQDDTIIANNRISGSTNENILDAGGGTVTDSNLTGGAN